MVVCQTLHPPSKANLTRSRRLKDYQNWLPKSSRPRANDHSILDFCFLWFSSIRFVFQSGAVFLPMCCILELESHAICCIWESRISHLRFFVAASWKEISHLHYLLQHFGVKIAHLHGVCNIFVFTHFPMVFSDVWTVFHRFLMVFNDLVYMVLCFIEPWLTVSKLSTCEIYALLQLTQIYLETTVNKCSEICFQT